MNDRLFCYERRYPLFFLLCTVSVIMVFLCTKLETGSVSNSKYNVFSIEFEYYGMDAEALERIVAAPLEERLSSLGGIEELRSCCEYGKSVTTVYFKKRRDNSELYLQLHAIAEDLHQLLPQDAQRPRVLSSGSTDASVLCIALPCADSISYTGEWAERVLKPRFEALPGVSQAEVSGGGRKEILVEFDLEKTIRNSWSPAELAAVIQDGNSVSGGTILRGTVNNQSVAFDTRLGSFSELGELPVKAGEGLLSVKHIAEVGEKERTPERVVRINGDRVVCVSVRAASDGNRMRISSECARILGELHNEFPDLECTVLYDLGAEQKRLLRSVVSSLAQGFVLMGIVLPLFFSSVYSVVIMLLTLLVTCLWTLGILALLRINLTQDSVAGISIALGLIIDSSLLFAEETELSATVAEFYRRARGVRAALLSAVLTSLAALVPLYFLDGLVPGVRTVAVTISVMLGASLVLNLVFVPCFLYPAGRDFKPFALLCHSVSRKIYRISFLCAKNSDMTSGRTAALYFALAVCPFLVFALSGKQLFLVHENSFVFVSADFNSNLSAAGVDASIKKFVQALCAEEGVEYVKSESQRGSAAIEVGFSAKGLDALKVRKLVEGHARLVPDGFVYAGGNSFSERKRLLEVEIAVLGDDSKRCRSYAESAAQGLDGAEKVQSVVLNFKSPERQYVFVPDYERLAKNQLTVQQTASMLRWILFGPVADKWLKDGFEQDVRVRAQGFDSLTPEGAIKLLLPTAASYVPLSSLGCVLESEGQGKIYRKNGRRAAFFTVETVGLSSSRALSLLKSRLSDAELDKGYGFSFPRELERLSGEYRLLFIVYVLCVVFIFLLITALTESVRVSFLVISIIPVSVAAPLLLVVLLRGTLEMGTVIALVILSGISVNNSIYIAASVRSRMVFRVRERIKSIFLTSLTTALGCIPLALFCRDSLAQELSFFMLLGSLSSLFTALFLFPRIFAWGLSCGSMRCSGRMRPCPGLELAQQSAVKVRTHVFFCGTSCKKMWNGSARAAEGRPAVKARAERPVGKLHCTRILKKKDNRYTHFRRHI